MNTVQAAAVITLSLTAAARIVLFDTRGKTHKPLPAFIAWLTVVWLGSLAFAAAFSLYNLTCWLLIFGLALHTGAVLWSGGNISRIQPKRPAKTLKEANPCKTSISTGCEEMTSAKSSSSNKAARRSDLTGYRADLHIRPEEGSPVELSTGNGLTIENHKITIEIAHEKTKNAEWRAAPWDLQLTTPEGRVKTICGGIVRLRQDITR